MASHPADRRRDVGERLRELSRATRLIRQHRAQHQPAVPPGLLGVLTEIGRLGDGQAARGCHAKQLATRCGLDPSTVSRAVAALVGHGLVERRVDLTDRRASILVVTAAGRTALGEAERWYDDLLRRALAGWTPPEAEAFLDALGRFTAGIERALATPRTGPDPTTRHLEAAR